MTQRDQIIALTPRQGQFLRELAANNGRSLGDQAAILTSQGRRLPDAIRVEARSLINDPK